MGIVFYKTGDLDHAIEHYEKAGEGYAALKEDGGVSAAYGNMGVVHQTRGEAGQARESLMKSIGLFDELGAADRAAKCREILSGLDAGAE